MITYALDSNIVSYLLKRDIQTWKRYNQEADAGKECVIPPIVYYEVKRGLLAVDATKSSHKSCRLRAERKPGGAAWCVRDFRENRQGKILSAWVLFLSF